jgi:hypothetical protein
MDLLKVCIGTATVLLSIAGHAPYIRDIYKGRTKPHVYAWFIWTVLTGLTCVAQLQEGAAAGAWTTATTAVMSLIIFCLALKRGTHDITKSDTLCLIGALVAIGFWVILRQPLLTVLLATLIDVLAFAPTVRKSLNRPEQETFTTYFIAVVRNGLALFAMNSYNLVTLIYPVSLLVMNAIQSVVLLVKDHLQPKKLFR